MTEETVRIVDLEPLRVAAALGFGTEPEGIAWMQILGWVQAQRIDPKARRFFGFNNPNPSAGSPNYGYEQWITAEPGEMGSDAIQIKDFPGGKYAVLRIHGVPMPDKWQKLVVWMQNSTYHMGRHQWLEECLTPEMIAVPEGTPVDWENLEFDLYLPIE